MTIPKRWESTLEGLLFWGAGTAGVYWWGLGWGLLAMIVTALLLGGRQVMLAPARNLPARPLGSGVSAFVPEQPLREPSIIGQHEYGMGGPLSDDLVLPDGAVIEGVFGGWATYGAGRFFVGITGAPQGRALVVYEAQRHRLYRVDAEQAGDLVSRLQRKEGQRFEQPPGELPVAASFELTRLAEKAGPFQPVAQLLLRAKPVSLQPFHGLWLKPADCPSPLPLQQTLQLRDGRRLELQLREPADRRHARNPHLYAARPPYEIVLDGQPTGRYTHNLREVARSADDAVLAIYGAVFGADDLVIDEVWHIHRQQQWLVVDALVASVPLWPGPRWQAPRRYELTAVRQISDRQISFALAPLADGEPQAPVSGHIALRSSLTATPQRLRVRAGVVTLPLAGP